MKIGYSSDRGLECSSPFHTPPIFKTNVKTNLASGVIVAALLIIPFAIPKLYRHLKQKNAGTSNQPNNPSKTSNQPNNPSITSYPSNKPKDENDYVKYFLCEHVELSQELTDKFDSLPYSVKKDAFRKMLKILKNIKSRHEKNYTYTKECIDILLFHNKTYTEINNEIFPPQIYPEGIPNGYKSGVKSIILEKLNLRPS